MATVGICTPHAGAVRPDHTRALMEMQLATPQHQFTHIDVDLMIVGKARNMCVEAGLPANLDVMWMIDDDVVVPPHAGVLIDQALALGIVSGVYYSRRLPYTPQLYTKATEPEYAGKYWPWTDEIPTKMFKIDAVGAGCLAVNTQVFYRMRDEITGMLRSQAEKVSVSWIADTLRGLSPWFEFLDKKGEDMYFCERAHDCGLDIWVNPEVQCLHIGEIPISKAHFDYLRDSGQLKREPL